MKITKEGKSGRNAEITINYKKKTANFKYSDGITEKTGWRLHIIAVILPVILWYITFFFIAKYYKVEEAGIGTEGLVYKLGVGVLSLLVGAGYLYISMQTSYLLHKYIKPIRDAYPKTNAILHRIKKWKKIDLTKKYHKRTILIGNKLYIADYSIVYFEYKYNNAKENPIIQIETKITKKKSYDYWCIITFAKKPTKGYFYYK